MKEKDFNQEFKGGEKKLDWETPKLISLDKGKTEGGTAPDLPEGTTYSGDVS